MDIYNKVRDIIIDVVTKRYHELDIKTLSLITCEQPKNLKFGELILNSIDNDGTSDINILLIPFAIDKLTSFISNFKV